MTIILCILLSSIVFVGFFIWYLAADTSRARRHAGLGAIIASLLTCGLALVPIKGKSPISLGLDLQGGTEFLLEVQGNPDSKALNEAAEVLRKRLDFLGTKEISIQPEGGNRLKIQVPGLKEAEIPDAKKLLTQAANLEFRLVPLNEAEIRATAEMVDGKPKLGYQYAGDYEILDEVQRDPTGKPVKSQIVVERQTRMSGDHISSARRGIEQLGQYVVQLDFDSEGAKQFGDLTSANVGRQLAIVLDGVVRSAPVIREAMTGGHCQISGGNMNALECEELASVLTNPLKTPVELLNVTSVDASLGADSIKSGLHAGIIALILVISFMVIYYRVSGLIAVLALAVNLVLLFGLLAQFHFTLTLPGIAGIVLTIGMAVDANVLIYERIRDELALGKPARSAIDAGFERAFSAIFDSNVTTLIPAAVLATLGTGPLRGFAVTLVLGIVANLFAALVVTRTTFDWILSGTEKPNLSMMQFIKSPRIDFLKYRGLGLMLSVLILAGGFFAVYRQGDALLGVDFKGGDSVIVFYQEKVEVSQLRTVLRANGVKEATLQYAPQYGQNQQKALLVETEPGQGDHAAQILHDNFPNAGFVAGGSQQVGARVGEEMKQKALTALLMGLFGILAYAAIRFEWSYAVAAAIGQLHDVLIALAVMAMLGREMTLPLVGALLTIAGYSINDKIVVFDRIREGARLREKGTFYEVINRSLNLTLARTILTGSTCLLATAALIIFGGPVIHDFSLAMFIGILSGIYSSHFISPGLAWWLGRNGSASNGAGNSPAQPAPKKTPIPA